MEIKRVLIEIASVRVKNDFGHLVPFVKQETAHISFMSSMTFCNESVYIKLFK